MSRSLRTWSAGSARPAAGAIDGRDQLVDRRPVVRGSRPEPLGEGGVGSHHHVAAELAEILERSARPSPWSESSRVDPKRPRVPDLAVRAAPHLESSVQDPIRVGQDGKRQSEMVAVRGEVFGRRKGDRDDGGVTEFVEAVAHGDQVLLARQSHQVTMKDQQRGAARMVGESPPLASMIDQFDVVQTLADLHAVAPLPMPVIVTANLGKPVETIVDSPSDRIVRGVFASGRTAAVDGVSAVERPHSAMTSEQKDTT